MLFAKAKETRGEYNLGHQIILKSCNGKRDQEDEIEGGVSAGKTRYDPR